MFKNLKMRNKLLAAILSSTISIFIIAGAIIIINVSVTTNDMSKSLINEMANRYGNEIKLNFEKLAVSANTINTVFQDYQNMQKSERRKEFIQILKSVLADNPQYYAVWSVWEPNVIDGMDSAFKDKPGCNDLGRFGPTWFRHNGNIELTSTLESEVAEPDGYFQMGKRELNEFIDNPAMYSYTGKTNEAVFTASFVVPIINDNRFLGVVGIDILLDNFQSIIGNVHPMESGYALLLANNLIRAAHPKSNLVGKSFLEGNTYDPREKDSISNAVQNGLPYSLKKKSLSNHQESFFYFTPLSIGKTHTPWSLVISIPVDVVMKKTNQIIVIFLMIILISILILSLVIFFVANFISKPIMGITSALANITDGEGDLTKRINFNSTDELGMLSDNFNKFINQLNLDLIQVEQSSGNIKTASDQSKILMDSSSQNLDVIKTSIHEIENQTENATSGIEELTATLEEMSRNINSIMNNMVRQASAVEEGASSIEEMVRNIENTAGMSKKTHDISNNLNNVANEGSSSVKDSIKSIRDVSDYSQQILKLLGLITNIAKQTNLLAMNAAIEAAHAGEAGKGFAIVADEIRRLSEDTNKNARDIGDVVSSIIGRIDDSVRLAEKAGIGLDMITAYSSQNAQIISQLNIAMSEQSSGAKEILKSTQELVKITEEVKLSMTEQKSATDEFSGALRDLRDLSIENKENIDRHLDNLTSLINSLEKVKQRIIENQALADNLHNLVDKFVLTSDTPANESTGLKLVE